MKPLIYIDDEPMLCRVFKRIFERISVPVVTFTDPVEAIAYLRDHPAAVVICDYLMPRLTGLDVLEHVPVGTPFFLVSGGLAITLGDADPRISGILTKPFGVESLLETMRPFLSAE